jgi:hypothetical protein
MVKEVNAQYGLEVKMPRNNGKHDKRTKTLRMIEYNDGTMTKVSWRFQCNKGIVSGDGGIAS